MTRFREVREIRLELLTVSEQQARTRGVDKDIDELAENIRLHDQLEPIVVAPLDDGMFEIIAGQRRFLAMRHLGRESILAAILDEPLDAANARALSISENVVRRNLDAKDLIDACTDLYRKYGSIKSVADELGLPYNSVRPYVKFERLRSALQSAVEGGELDIKTALKVEDKLGDRVIEPSDLCSLCAQLSQMTHAQRSDYVKESSTDDLLNSHTPSVQLPSRPGRVRQIVVTLREDHYEGLRRWASDESMTQDRAAARIISSFLVNVGSPSR